MMRKMIFVMLCSSFFLFTIYRMIDTPQLVNFLFPGLEEEMQERADHS
ncbi:hypothetical protein [Bacillus sp. AFS019443]|nr:hypothetical protein [Bacillus sp. AFS019443]